MDTELLAKLDTDLVQQSLAIWSQIQQPQADLQRIRDRIQDAQATVQAVKSASVAVSQSAKEDLQRIVTIADSLTNASAQIQNLLGIDVQSLKGRVQALKAGLQNNAVNLQAAAVQNLDLVITTYQRIEQLQRSDDALGAARNAFAAYVSQWLNKDFVFSIGGKAVKVHFKTALGATLPFSPSANLSAQVVYSAFTVTIEKIFLKYDTTDKTVTPDFSQAKVSPNFNVAQFASQLGGLVAGGLPGISVSNPRLDPLDGVPTILVDSKFAGLPVFSAMSFNATLRVESSRVNIEDAAGGIDTLLVPVPPGAMAIKGFGFGYQKSPVLDLNGPSLRVTTSVVPLADGGTGATIAFNLKPTPQATNSGLFLPIENLGRVFAFQGKLALLQTFDCGTVHGKFDAEASTLDVHLEMPTQGTSTPFGGEKIFSLVADGHIDESGIIFKGKAVYLSFIHGNIAGDISFSGGGHITSSLDAGSEAFGAKASFAADWEPGFKTLTIYSSASVDINIKGFAGLSAAVQIACLVENGSGTAKATAEIMGQSIVEKAIPLNGNLSGFLSELLKPDVNAIISKVFEKGKELLKQLDPGELNHFLRRSFASLDPFELVPDAVPDAEAMFKDAEKKIKQAQDAANDTVNKIVGVGKKWVRKVPGLGLTSGGVDLGLFDLPTILPSTINSEFLKKVDALLDEINKMKQAKLLADRLSEGRFKVPDPVNIGVPGTDDRISSRVDYTFDQVVVAANGVDPSQKTAAAKIVSFLVTGGSTTRRGGQSVEADLNEWGYVKFEEVAGNTRATVFVSSSGKPITDASLLGLAKSIYDTIKTVINEQTPNIEVVSSNGPDGDLDQPQKPVNYFFDHPPKRKLPIIGRLGILRVAVTATGARVIKIAPDSAADRGGIKIDDVVQQINGVAVDSAQRLSSVIKSSLTRDLALKLLSSGIMSDVNIKLDEPKL